MKSMVLIHGFLGEPSDWGEVQSSLATASDALSIPVADSWQSGLETIRRT